MTDATLCQNYAFMLELCQLCFYAFMPKAMLASSGKAKGPGDVTVVTGCEGLRGAAKVDVKEEVM